MKLRTDLHIAFCISLLLAGFSRLKAQESYFQPVASLYDKYRSEHLQEKLFVHCDRDNYLAGEICWFSLYEVDGTQMKPLQFSRVAYVEILDGSNHAVLQAKIELKDGKGAGSFYLPVSLSSGRYLLRAYTNWMKNAGPEYFFYRTISIVNTFKPLTLSPADTAAPADIQFFPEGGNLVAGLESVVGFKASDRYGRGIEFDGYLLDDAGDTVLHFNPLHAGMGRFRFTPQPGSRYMAVVVLRNGTRLRHNLPFVYDKGYVMEILRPAPGHFRVAVRSRLALSGRYARDIYLLVHARQQFCVAKAAELVNGEALFDFVADNWAPGIVHFTLFNGARQPVCERLAFIDPEKNLVIRASADKPEFDTREPVTLQLQSQTESGKPADSRLSVSVYRVDDWQGTKGGDIYSYFWLSSDLRGYIEDPAWYFESGHREASQALDNLLLTQGWSRFSWDDILLHKSPDTAWLPEYEGMLVEGRIRSTYGQPAVNVMTSFSVPGNRLQFYQSVSDDKGRFWFNVKDYYGREEVIVKAMGEHPSPYQILLDTPFSRQYVSYPLSPLHLEEQWKRDFTARHVSMQVRNVFEGSRVHQLEVKPWDSLCFYGPPRNHYFLDDYTRFVTMEEVLREYVPMVTIRRIGGKFHLRMVDEAEEMLYTADPLILLNAVPVSSDSLLQYDPLKVKSLSLVTGRYIRGNLLYDGVVDFRTYDELAEEVPLEASALKLEYDGLQQTREFYSPRYATSADRKSPLPDFRELLYWTPDQETGPTGTAKLKFFTSDWPGQYVIVVQGMDNSGRLGSAIGQFRVTGKSAIQ